MRDEAKIKDGEKFELKKVEVPEEGGGAIPLGGAGDKVPVNNMPGLSTFHDFRSWRR